MGYLINLLTCLLNLWLPGFPGSSVGKESACSAGDLRSIPDPDDPLEMEMAAHSRILAW